MPESRDDSAPRLDWLGFVLSFAALTVLIWGLIEAPSREWTDGLVLAAFALAALGLALFVAWERRAPAPMLDLALFRNPRFSASSAAISLAFFALSEMIFFLTQYLQEVRGYTALEAGLRTMPVAGGLDPWRAAVGEADREARDPGRRALRPGARLRSRCGDLVRWT